jgi:hypothetical protein
MRLLYDNYDAVTRRATTIEVDSESGLPIIVRTQDTRPIVESAKAIASNFDKHTHGRQNIVHVARIPAVQWAQLCRLGITRDPVAFTAWLNSREARALRCDDGRRL